MPIFAESSQLLAVALLDVALLLQPDLVIIGGGLARARELLVQPTVNIFLGHPRTDLPLTTTIIPSRLGDKAPLLGGLSMLSANE